MPDRLDDDEVELVLSKIQEHLGEPDFALPEGDQSASGNMIDAIDEDLLAEFMDRLDASNLDLAWEKKCIEAAAMARHDGRGGVQLRRCSGPALGHVH